MHLILEKHEDSSHGLARIFVEVPSQGMRTGLVILVILSKSFLFLE